VTIGQVVVITGKKCSGKSELASQLHHCFEYFIIKSDSLVTKDNSNASNWMINATHGAIASGKSVVVDCLKCYEEVLQFRRVFGEKLIHVHLYASSDSLKERYRRLISGEVPGAPSYEEADYLKDNAHIQSLKNDADVRIYTERSDSKDALIRVAASLRLFSPPDVKCVDVVIGGQFGSEGKGNIVAYLAREYDVLVRVGGPNAGHTVASMKGPYTYHHLPSGARDVNARILLGPGMTIRLTSLLKEIRECEISPDRLFIDPQATIIEDEDTESERAHLVSTIASTGSGSGAAIARRILSRGEQSKIRLAKDVVELQPYVGVEGKYHGCTTDRLEEAYRNKYSILLEGTQGSGLSLFHGVYPYVTSRDTNVAGCLAEAGISPRRVRRIVMVVRPMPIRVGNPDGEGNYTSGPLKHETSFDEIAEKSGLDAEILHKAEKTSTTNRKRRVGWFDWGQFRRACSLNAPTDIVLTFADYLKESNMRARRFEQLDSDTIKFVEELERVSQAPVSLINTRFQRADDGSGDFRSIIDRRNWTGDSANKK
jgi:adenylosuccinate synthase